MNRLRTLRAGALGCAVASLLVVGGVARAAAPDDPINEVLQNGNAEWSDSFDAASVGAADVRTSVPTLSPDILAPMQAAIAQYSQIAAQGGWPSVPTDKALKIGMSDPAVAILRQRLAITGDLPPEAGNSQSPVFDSYVDAAVRRFQARHGIQPDGIVGDSTLAAMNIPVGQRLTQLANNLTRLKAFLSKPLPPRYIMVNIPAASVEAVENGVVVQRHTAVVGKPDRPSPIVNSKVSEINFHPYWTVPASIIKKDLIPLMQKDPTYLATWKIRVFDKKGQEVQPEQINWQTDDATNYMFKQDPGDQNSLGIVKINFASPEGVYMHDTPHKGTFNDDYRFDSSGCVRVQNIRELIQWILRDTPGQTPDAVEQELASDQRLDVKVTNPVALHWVYITAWSTKDGVVNFRDDIYNLDGLQPGGDDSDAAPAAADGSQAPAPATTASTTSG